MKRFISVFIILCAAFLRLYRLPEFAMFLADQGRDAIIVKRIALFEHFPAIGPPSSIGQVYLGPFYYYLIAPFLIPFNLHPVGLAFAVAILSIVGIVFAFIVLKKEVGLVIATAFLILTTFSYHLIEFNRFSWNPNLLPYFSFFTLYFLYKTVTSKKWYHPFIFGIFFALSFQLHHLAAFMIVPIGIVFLYKIVSRRQYLVYLKSIGVSLLGFTLISLPLIIFDLKHDFINTKNLDSLFTKQNIVAGGSPLTRLLETNQALWSIVFQTNFSSLVAGLISIAVVGALYLLHRKKKVHPLILIHALNAFSFIYLFSLLSSSRLPHYYGVAYLSIFTIIGALLGLLPKKPGFTIIACIFIGVYILLQSSHYYFIAGPSANQMNQAKKIADSIAPTLGDKKFNFATYPIEFTSEETYLYFLEIAGHKAADRTVQEVTDQMIVLCDRGPCDILHTGSWNINMFGKAKIDKMWKVDNISMFKLIHTK